MGVQMHLSDNVYCVIILAGLSPLSMSSCLAKTMSKETFVCNALMYLEVYTCWHEHSIFSSFTFEI